MLGGGGSRESLKNFEPAVAWSGHHLGKLTRGEGASRGLLGFGCCPHETQLATLGGPWAAYPGGEPGGKQPDGAAVDSTGVESSPNTANRRGPCLLVPDLSPPLPAL